MAYLFPEASHLKASIAPTSLTGAIAPPSSNLTPLEWSVLALGRRDGMPTIKLPSRFSMIVGVLFGARQNPRLSDPRLEALRRMAVLSRYHGRSVQRHEVLAFLAAGFTPGQYELVVASAEAANYRTASDRP